MADDVVRTSSRHGWMAPMIRGLTPPQLLKVLHGQATMGLTVKDLQELVFDLLDEAKLQPLEILRAIKRREVPNEE